MKNIAVILAIFFLVGCGGSSSTTPPALTITTTTLPAATVNQPYVATLTASGGTTPYSWTIVSGIPPAGIVLNSIGILQGTPTERGDFSFVVQVTDSSSNSQSMAVKVNTGEHK